MRTVIIFSNEVDPGSHLAATLIEQSIRNHASEPVMVHEIRVLPFALVQIKTILQFAPMLGNLRTYVRHMRNAEFWFVGVKPTYRTMNEVCRLARSVNWIKSQSSQFEKIYVLGNRIHFADGRKVLPRTYQNSGALIPEQSGNLTVYRYANLNGTFNTDPRPDNIIRMTIDALVRLGLMKPDESPCQHILRIWDQDQITRWTSIICRAALFDLSKNSDNETYDAIRTQLILQETVTTDDLRTLRLLGRRVAYGMVRNLRELIRSFRFGTDENLGPFRNLLTDDFLKTPGWFGPWYPYQIRIRRRLFRKCPTNSWLLFFREPDHNDEVVFLLKLTAGQPYEERNLPMHGARIIKRDSQNIKGVVTSELLPRLKDG